MSGKCVVKLKYDIHNEGVSLDNGNLYKPNTSLPIMISKCSESESEYEY